MEHRIRANFPQVIAEGNRIIVVLVCQERFALYIHIERSLFLNTLPDDYHVKVAKTQEEITQLLETGFEYVLQKDDLAFFRKRK